jgi:flagellar motor switch protein FliM
MSDLLTQEEIDALMGVFDENTEHAALIKESTFLNPGQMQVLEQLHRELASGFEGAANTLLHGGLELSVDALEEGRAVDERLGRECYLFALTPHAGINHICIDNAVALSLLERLLGGEGELSSPERPLSAMEKLLFERFWQLFRDGLNALWRQRESVSVIPLDAGEEESRQGIKVLLTLRTKGASGSLELFYDAKTLQRLLRGIEAKTDGGGEHVLIEADLGRCYLGAEKRAMLKKGDVILLETAAPKMVTLSIDGHPCCLGEITKDDRDSLSVRVTKRLANDHKERVDTGRIAYRVRIGTAILLPDDFMQLQYDTPIALERGQGLELIADHKVIALGKKVVHEGNVAVEVTSVFM